MNAPSSADLRIVVLYPLSTTAQGDEGNARVLARRAALRGFTCTLSTHHLGTVPTADLYLLGGLDTPRMAELVAHLQIGALAPALERGAVLLGVGAGYHLLGRRFTDPRGAEHAGLGLLDIHTTRSARPALGPVITRPSPRWRLDALSGYENHQCHTHLGPTAEPLAQIELGAGNGDGPCHTSNLGDRGDRSGREGRGNVEQTDDTDSERRTVPSDYGRAEGAVSGHVIGTNLHGPVLSRNADLADLLLGWALGQPLPPADSTAADELRRRRIDEDRADPSGWAGEAHGPPTVRRWVQRHLRRRG